MKEYHILNGDALKEQFPDSLGTELIIARECMVDGPVTDASLAELFALRSKFISEEYGIGTKEDYIKSIRFEIEKIKVIDEYAAVNLWFEDDLFCQVNFWFIASVLLDFGIKSKVYLVRPKVQNKYGFGGLAKEELIQRYQERIEIKNLEQFANLWKFYCRGKLEEMLELAKRLSDKFPFVDMVVKAHIERGLHSEEGGRPTRVLRELIEKHGENNFAEVFKSFSESEHIYGFGDIQVKRIFDKIIKGAV